MTPQRRHQVRYPDIAKPLPVPEIEEYNKPLTPPQPSPWWNKRNLTDREQRWVRKERQA